MDRRRYGRVPFGYDIVDGAAVINEADAGRLRLFFRVFMSGESMAEAARQAGLQCSATTYPHLFKRKEYRGTDYYPAIITGDYQRGLIAEWERRRGEKRGKGKQRNKGRREERKGEKSQMCNILCEIQFPLLTCVRSSYFGLLQTPGTINPLLPSSVTTLA